MSMTKPQENGTRCAMPHLYKRWGTILLVLLAAVLFAGLVIGITTPQVRAANFDLTGSCPGGVGDVAALITAINTANANGEADVITLATGCVYTLIAVDNTTDGDNGLPVISSEITFTGNGAIFQRDNITPAPDFRIFYVGSSGDLTLNDLTVQNGVAEYGAGIYNDGGRVTLSGVTVRDNSATSFGGGIENLGTLDAQGSTIAGNSSDDSSAGIYNEGPMTLSQSTVSGNIAARDGGGIANYGDVTISNSTIANNQAQGVDLFEGRGGGIGHWRGDMQIINSTLSNNIGKTAGAIHFFGDGGSGTISMTLTYATIFSNSSGISMEAMFGDEIRYRNSIIAGNTAFDCDTVDGTFTSLGYNLLGNTGGCPGGGTGDQTTADPLLGELADNGGRTWTHALLDGSPALDQIPTASCLLSEDQRGLSRPYPAGGNCDTGAYEKQPSPHVLNVTLAGVGTGTVTSTPPGINCGDTCSATLTVGTVVTLTATPDTGSSFGGWSANCTLVGGACVVTMTEDITATATFYPVVSEHVLNVTPAGVGAGTISSTPPGIHCGATCSAQLTAGTVVTLTATPETGSSFGGWSANCTAVGNACAVTMTSDITVTATFNPAIPKTYYVYMPLASKPAYPDLVVQNVFNSSDSITVVIKNIGLAPVVTPFWVDAYIDPHPAPVRVNDIWYDGRSAQGIVWGVTDALLPMQPGTVITLTYGDVYDGGSRYTFFTGNLSPGTPVWAQVDSYDAATTYGAVLESHEANGGAYNNIFAPIDSTWLPNGSKSIQSLTPVPNISPAVRDHLPLRPGR